MRGKRILASLIGVGLFVTNIPASIVANALSNSFSNISFEENEDISFVKAETGATIETTGFGSTDGTSALSVKVTYKSNQESTGVVIDKAGTWDFGNDSTLFVDFYNTNDSNTQARIDVIDINGNTRTNYYTVYAWEKPRLAMSNFGPLKADFTKANGWWGAEGGIDFHKVDKIKIYTWGNNATKFVLDSIRVASPETASFARMSFEDGLVPEFAYKSNSNLLVVSQGNTDGTKALKVDFGAGGFPSVRFLPENNFNWGAGACLTFDVTNPTNSVNTVHVKVVDGSGAETVGRVTVPANTTKSAFMSFNTRAMYLGMRFFPPTNGRDRVSYAWGAKGLDISDIKEFSFFIYTPAEKSTLIFDNIQVLPDPAVSTDYLTGIIDKYGQYTGRNWVDKIDTDAELVNSVAKEKAWMQANPQDTSQRSKYGGWLTGPKLTATGHFRTEKYNGKWTLVDPEGYIYFSTGLDILRFDDMKTWITGRENMFNPLPPANSHYQSINSAAVPPLGLTSGYSYNFYTANLEKKYGSSYSTQWANMTIDRMKNWGFTSLGNWSEPSLFWGTAASKQMPFVADTWIRGNFAVIDDGMAAGMLVPDAYDPSFKQAAQGAINSLQGTSLNTNPWCMGVYINNEISWGNPFGDQYSVIVAALKKDAGSSAAKKAFVQLLKNKYTSISQLNTAWGTSFASFDALNASIPLPAQRTDGLKSDLSMMLYNLAKEYYKTVNDYFHQMYPNSLNLGSRLAEWGCPAEVEKACSENVDVLSYNCYKESVNTEDWMHAEQLDVPTIIGEFHFGSEDERMFSPGLVAATNQQERGEMYVSYITDLLKTNTFVGGHWFQYIDQPNTGRSWDGENYNAGFVDVCDVPYYPLVEAAKGIHSQMYSIKYVELPQITISMQSTARIDVAKNNSIILVPTVTAAAGVDKTIIYSSNDTAVATVDSNGHVTGIKNGTATITAKSKVNANSKATCVVTVVNASQTVTPIVTLDKTVVTIDMATATTSQLTATVTPDTVTDKAVTWSSSNTSVATVNASGLVTAVAEGTATITAASKADSTKKSTCTVTVKAAPVQPPVTNGKTVVSFENGENTSFITSLNGATTTVVSQGTNEGTKALEVNVGTLNAQDSGIKINPADLINLGDNPKITAYLTNPNNQDIQIRMDVVDKETAKNPVDGVIRTYYYTLSANQSKAVTIQNLGAVSGNFTGVDGWWGDADGVDTSNIDYINVYMWEKRPNLTATKFIVDNITWTTKTTGTVTPIVTLNKTAVTIDMVTATTSQLTATVTPDTVTDKAVTWSSSNTAIATVNASGLVIAVAEGTATITATSKADSTKKATCTVTVKAAKIPIALSINKTTANLNNDTAKQIQLTVTVSPQTSPDKTVTWTSSNVKVATVDSAGLVTAKGNGTTTITATSNYDTSKTVTCAITVTGFTEEPVEIINFMNRISFEDGESSAALIKKSSTTNIVSDNGITQGQKALKVIYNTGTSSIDFVPVDGNPWVIGKNPCITFSAKSQVATQFDLYVTADLVDKATGATSQQVNKIAITPANQMKITTAYNISQGNLAIRDFGNVNGSGVVATTLVSGPANIGAYNITKLTFSVSNAPAGMSVILDSIKITNDATRVNLGNYYYLDEYGQSNYKDYPEKIKNDAQLLEAEAKEQTQLDKWIAELEANPSRDQFGGWRNEALKQQSTGRFYTKKVQGQWVMIDPEGYPYLSTGLDVIRVGDQNTWTSGREAMFENLPDQNGKFSEHFAGLGGCPVSPDGSSETNLGINFYTMNLEKKYGDDWLEKWINNTIKRTKAWGFTSFGCWSDPEIAFGKGNQVKTPYAANFWVNGTHAMLNLDGPGWGYLADPFDPQFERDVYAGAMSVRETGADKDPWCIGVFVDNEIHWGNQDKKYLVQSLFWYKNCNTEPAYAKLACIDWLKQHYHNNINELNADWNANPSPENIYTTNFKSFDDLKGQTWIHYACPDSVKSAMFDLIFEKYYSTVSSIVKRVLPNTMYLGSRFADWGCPKGASKIAAKYCDVVSFNSYKTHPIQSWMELDTFDKPIIIGEFHLNSCERGAITRGLVPVWPQDRERMTVDYLNDIEDNNKLVGIHWFQYYDEPILGRAWDGENSDTGFVDVTDQPYDSLVNAARTVNKTMYENKFKNFPVSITPKPAVDPVFPDKLSPEPEPLPDLPKLNVPEFAGLTFEGNDTSIYRLTSTNNSNAQVVTGTGVTQGIKALKYTVTKLDKTGGGVYSHMLIATPNVFGLDMSKGISYDVTNPCSYKVQLRVNISSNGSVATFYYLLNPGETRHINMVETGPSTINVSNPRQGYWGLDSGIRYDSINSVSFYVWEDSPDLSAQSTATLIFDNIQAIKN